MKNEKMSKERKEFLYNQILEALYYISSPYHVQKEQAFDENNVNYIVAGSMNDFEYCLDGLVEERVISQEVGAKLKKLEDELTRNWNFDPLNQLMRNSESLKTDNFWESKRQDAKHILQMMGEKYKYPQKRKGI